MIHTRAVTTKGNAWFSLIPPPFPGQPRSITSDSVTFVFFLVLVLCTAVLDFPGISGPVGPGAESVNAAAVGDRKPIATRTAVVTRSGAFEL